MQIDVADEKKNVSNEIRQGWKEHESFTLRIPKIMK